VELVPFPGIFLATDFQFGNFGKGTPSQLAEKVVGESRFEPEMHRES
jgi:hypothetical protein